MWNIYPSPVIKFLKPLDILSGENILSEVKETNGSPLKHRKLGKNKTLGMLFFNASLRIRLSTQKAALNLGMDPIVMNVSGDDDGVGDGNDKGGVDAMGVMRRMRDRVGQRQIQTWMEVI